MLQETSAGVVALVAMLVALGWLFKKAWTFLRLTMRAVDTIRRNSTPTVADQRMTLFVRSNVKSKKTSRNFSQWRRRQKKPGRWRG